MQKPPFVRTLFVRGVALPLLSRVAFIDIAHPICVLRMLAIIPGDFITGTMGAENRELAKYLKNTKRYRFLIC